MTLGAASRGTKNRALPGAAGAIALGLLGLSATAAGQEPDDRRTLPGGPPPNVIVVVVDDLRWDELAVAGHPYLDTPNIDRLAREGVTFSRAFHASPLCSPNRASILTGQYPSRHGIIDNIARDVASHGLVTFPAGLQATGYKTAFIGKWHMGNDPTPRPGFDYWLALPGQGRSVDPQLFEDGRLHVVGGYTTDILTERALAFIEREAGTPFFLYLGHKAIHPDVVQRDDGSIDLSMPARYVPAPRHEGLYSDAVLPPRENVVTSLDELIDRPVLRRALELKHSAEMARELEPLMFDYTTNQDIIRGRAEMLLAVDEGLGEIMDALERLGELQNTAIFFTSDNGYWYGEHGLSNERRLPYEEAVRMPLLLRYPRLARPGTELAALVSSVDMAPTILQLAGASIGRDVQGRSLVPLLRGPVSSWRDTVLIEFYSHENPMPWLVDMDYKAVRSERYKFVHWVRYPDEDELYDLLEDPYETRNAASDPAYRDVLTEMRGKLQRDVLDSMAIGWPRP